MNSAPAQRCGRGTPLSGQARKGGERQRGYRCETARPRAGQRGGARPRAAEGGAAGAAGVGRAATDAFVTSFIAPRLITDIAETLHPAPSGSAMEAAIDEGMDALPSWSDRTAAVQARLMDEYNVETVEAIPTSVAGHTLLEAERDETAVYRDQIEMVQGVYAAQEEVMQLGAVLSPVLAIQIVSMGFAGSDYLHHRHFVAAAEEYRYTFVQQLNQDMGDEGASWDYRIGRELWEQIPAFTYEPPTVAAIVGQYTMSIILLVGWTVVLLFAAPVAIASMKVQ